MTQFLAAVRTSSGLLFLSASGVWIVRSAFDPRGPQRLRTFRYEQSARGVAEEWARQTGYQAHVEAVR